MQLSTYIQQAHDLNDIAKIARYLEIGHGVTLPLKPEFIEESTEAQLPPKFRRKLRRLQAVVYEEKSLCIELSGCDYTEYHSTSEIMLAPYYPDFDLHGEPIIIDFQDPEKPVKPIRLAENTEALYDPARCERALLSIILRMKRQHACDLTPFDLTPELVIARYETMKNWLSELKKRNATDNSKEVSDHAK